MVIHVKVTSLIDCRFEFFLFEKISLKPLLHCNFGLTGCLSARSNFCQSIYTDDVTVRQQHETKVGSFYARFRIRELQEL